MDLKNLDDYLDQNIFVHRVCKIQYSNAFENYISNFFQMLKKEYNVYTIKDLFSEAFSEAGNNYFNGCSLGRWCTGLIKNFLGLVPNYGAVLTVIFSVADTIDFLKTSDLDKLKEHLQLKEKPHKRYKKLKNILLIPNCSYLSKNELKTVNFIKELIERKFITNTLLIVCEPLDFSSGLMIKNEASYKIILNKDSLKEICGFDAKENLLEIINVIGIEHADDIINLDDATTQDNDDNVLEQIIKELLSKPEDDGAHDLFDFLKLCSLLFDNFTYEDIEDISTANQVGVAENLKKSVGSKILEMYLPNEYRFFMEVLRKYCQECAQFYNSEVKTRIFKYLKEKYPTQYTDLALTGILTCSESIEKISFCLKAIYYEKNTAPLYKINQILEYFSKTHYVTLKNIPQLNDIYYSMNYSLTDVKELCGSSFWRLNDLTGLSPEDKLICLSIIAKVSYEIMSQDFLRKIDELYRHLLQEIKISSTYKQYTSFILDYLVFSTCIENCYKTTQVAQRLVAYLEKTSLSPELEIKYLRLGNALFYNDYSEAMARTKKAYTLSEWHPVEKKYCAINYSSSLAMCGEYTKSYNILLKEFNNIFFKNNAVSISATNNYIIAAYLSGNKDIQWVITNFLNLNSKINDYEFSDQQIINNNLQASYILEGNALDYNKIIKTESGINSDEKDIYHCFFMHYNLMIFYFLTGDSEAFLQEQAFCTIPGLLAPYQNFFTAKIDFLQQNIAKGWNIQQLTEHLNDWGEIYPDKKYTLYKYPILFGFIERWFE